MRPPVPDLTEVKFWWLHLVLISLKISHAVLFTQVHGPLYPTERRHEFPRDPPPRSVCHLDPYGKVNVRGRLCFNYGTWKEIRVTAKHNWGWHDVNSWKRPVHNPGSDPCQENAKYPTMENIDKEFIRCHRPCTVPVFFGKLKSLHFSSFLLFCRVESKAKDDFKFPVMVEDGKHSCTEACSIHPTKS